MNFLASIFFLLIATAIFCWLFTADLALGPICRSAFFLGGIVAIGLVGVASLHLFRPQS